MGALLKQGSYQESRSNIVATFNTSQAKSVNTHDPLIKIDDPSFPSYIIGFGYDSGNPTARPLSQLSLLGCSGIQPDLTAARSLSGPVFTTGVAPPGSRIELGIKWDIFTLLEASVAILGRYSIICSVESSIYGSGGGGSSGVTVTNRNPVTITKLFGPLAGQIFTDVPFELPIGSVGWARGYATCGATFEMASFLQFATTPIVVSLGVNNYGEFLQFLEVSYKIVFLDGSSAAVLHPNGDVYFFRNTEYRRYNFTPNKVETTGIINHDGWFGVWADGIDAAIRHPDGDAYFFRGNQYQRFKFSPAPGKADGPPETINANGWFGLWTDGIDGAVMHPNGDAYFFRGNQFQRYNFAVNKVISTGTIGVDDWFGVWPDGIDTAVNHPNGNVYFFRFNEYQAYSFAANKVAYTRTINVNGWFGVWPTP